MAQKAAQAAAGALQTAAASCWVSLGAGLDQRDFWRPAAHDTAAQTYSMEMGGDMLGVLTGLSVAAAELLGCITPGQYCDPVQKPIFDTAGWRGRRAIHPI